MKYLGMKTDDLIQTGGIHTAKEIAQQPELWQKVWEQICLERPSIAEFMNRALANSNRIILTGAGTSAFIGLSLRSIFQQNTGIITEAIATTDIVSHPRDYFLKNVPTLMISFARSGNSPESVAAIKLADEICKTCYHLIITCNDQGDIAGYGSMSDKFVIILPKESNDVSLAMTSSFTGMMLTGLLVAKIEKLESLQSSVQTLISYAQKFICGNTDELKEIAKVKFNRAVFLGGGCFYGIATESQLKLQELTNGEVICKNDSYLGFRHGPKAVVDKKTFVVYLVSSSNEYAFKYEKDLINSMKKGTQPMLEMSISETAIQDFDLNFKLHFSSDGKNLDDEFLAICYILPAQIIGFYKSIELGLRPDSPSVNNDISRVVEGVEIYSLQQ